jgi:hypothetical protein
MRRLCAAAAIVLASACTADEIPVATPPPTPAASPAQVGREGAVGREGEVVLRLLGLRLDATAEPGTDRIRIAPDAADGMRVKLVGSSGAVEACPLGSLTAADGTGPGCTPLGDGQELEVGLAAVEIRATSDVVGIDAVVLTYEPTHAPVAVRLPIFGPDDALGIEREPRGAGDIEATATWEGIGGGRLMILEGEEVRARAEGSSDQGPQNLRATAAPDPDERASVVFENTGARPLQRPLLRIDWP